MYRLFLAGLDAAVASILIIPVFLVLDQTFFHDRKKTLFYIVLSVYLAGVYLVVGLPNVTYIRFEANLNLIPFLNLFSNLSAALLNIILFFPLGFLSVLLWKPLRCIRYNLMLCFCLSLSIELLQLFTFRATDANDLITNTLGGLTGWFLGNAALNKFPRLSCNGTGKDAFVVFGSVLVIMFFIHPFIAPIIWNLIY